MSAAAIAVGACSGESGRKVPPRLASTAAPSGGPPQPVTTVTTAAPHVQISGLPLDATPYWKQTSIGEPQAIVDARANAFLITADERDAQLFLMGWIPNIDVDAVLLGEQIDAPVVLGGAWVSGYWHGAYRQSLVAATKPAVGADSRTAVDESQFSSLVESTKRSAAQRTAGGEMLLQSVDASLWRPATVSAGPGAFFGLVENFGAAYGAFRALVERPPNGADVLDDYDVVCTTGLMCEFATDRLNISSQLNSRFAQRLQRDSGLAGVRRRVDQVIAESTTRARAQWLSMIDSRALEPSDYRRLVALYSSRLEARWCATVAALEAVVERDDGLARPASQAAELLELWDVATRYGEARVEVYRAPDFVST